MTLTFVGCYNFSDVSLLNICFRKVGFCRLFLWAIALVFTSSCRPFFSQNFIPQEHKHAKE